MVGVSAPEEGSYQKASSSESKVISGLSCTPNARKDGPLSVRLIDDENPLADFEFDKLPTELLVEIFRRARADSLYDACKEQHYYPVALSHVCRHWRTVAIGAPTLWTDIRVPGDHTENTKEAARIYLERSKGCPIFLTWFMDWELSPNAVPEIVNNLIIPGAERWQRITLVADNKVALDAFLAAVDPLAFPILQDIEISCSMVIKPFSPKSTLCRSTPLLRRCKFRDIPSLPALPSNLVVLDCVFLALGSTEFNLDLLLEFLPHVAHSLEHLRFGPPPFSKVCFTPRAPKILLENLKSLLITYSHLIMDHILVPNVTYFAAAYSGAEARMAAEMFQGFSAPKLQSIQFHNTPLLPLLTTHNLPSMFPQLESVLLSDCTHESAFIPLLADTFSHMKELTISDMTIWTSLQAAIEKRLKNGYKSLRKIQLPKGNATGAITPHLRRWLPAHGIELVLYEPGELPRSTPEFQDEFCDEEDRLFVEATMRGSEYDDDGYPWTLWEGP